MNIVGIFGIVKIEIMMLLYIFHVKL